MDRYDLYGYKTYQKGQLVLFIRIDSYHFLIVGGIWIMDSGSRVARNYTVEGEKTQETVEI